MAGARKEPWNRSNPKKKTGNAKHLTPAQKATAKRAAKKAGRPYPNLVGNMRVAGKRGKKQNDRVADVCAISRAVAK